MWLNHSVHDLHPKTQISFICGEGKETGAHVSFYCQNDFSNIVEGFGAKISLNITTF